MPVNPFENMPAMLGRHVIAVDKFFESFNELKENGRAKDYVQLSPSDHLDNMDKLSTLTSLLKQSKAQVFFLSFVLNCLRQRINFYWIFI